jgi:S1-C subfamily serine protease
VVRVSTGAAGLATGFASGPGRVVTVAHAVDGGGPVSVRGADGVRRAATVLRVDARTDLALLAVRRLRAGRVRVERAGGGARIRIGRPGDGAAGGRVRRRVTARVSGVDGSVSARPGLELAARVRAGDSGAPVLTGGGRVAGVVFARSERHADTAYAVDGAAVAALIEEEQR